VVLLEVVVAFGRREARLAPSPCKFSELGNFQAIFRRRDSTVTDSKWNNVSYTSASGALSLERYDNNVLFNLMI